MDSKKDIIEVVNYLVSNNIKFVISRFPNSDDISLFIELENLGFHSFVIQAFDNSKKPLSISGDLVLKNEDIKKSNIDFSLLEFHQIHKNNTTDLNFFSQHDYENYVSNIVLACRNQKLKKGVCARIKKESKPKDFNIGEYFLKLTKNYGTAFVHLYFHPECGLWIGATPELLVRQSGKNLFETVSLAGTKLKTKNRDWTAKEIEEQQIVTNYIKDILMQNDCDIVNDTKAKTIDAGQIQHLKSEILFESSLDIKTISEMLHPTPAVCGMPKEQAFDLIKKHERNQRQNYTGFIGFVSKAESALYVNLRCMQILENDFLVYVGAGITKDSIPEDEWQETENKAQTLLRFVV